MKNIIQCFAVVFLVILMFINISAFAQEEEGHIFAVTTFKAVMPEGGSAAERDSLLMIGVELQKLNPKQLSVKLLRHRWGSNFQDWVFISEYGSWADIDVARDIDEENFKKKWPDKDWEKYVQAFGKYFPTHSDEIYTELPKFSK